MEMKKLHQILLADAIIECRRAYPDGKTKVEYNFSLVILLL